METLDSENDKNYNYKLKIYDEKNFKITRYENNIRNGFTVNDRKKIPSLYDRLMSCTCPIEAKTIIDKIYKSNNDSTTRTRKKLFDYAYSNKFEYFVTWTLNPKKIDRSDFVLISKTVSKWLNNLKSNKAKDLKYIIVPELHKDGLNWHFHAIISDIGDITLVEALNPHTGEILKDKTGRIIYNMENFKLGMSTVTKINSSQATAKYITKYITKDSEIRLKGKKKFWSSRNLDKPEILKQCLTPDEMLTLYLNFCNTANITDEAQYKIFENVCETFSVSYD